jgi:predicted DNA-binding transcriptional regulator YafY
VTVIVHFEAEEEAVFVVNGLGPRAEVLEPATLRQRVLNDASAVVSRLSTT